MGGWCREGQVKTYEVCRVIDRYTASGKLDYSYLVFRVWNAFKAIFGVSEWQKTVDFAKSTKAKIEGQEVQRGEISRVLSEALGLNWAQGRQVQLEKPKPCNMVWY